MGRAANTAGPFFVSLDQGPIERRKPRR